MTGEHLAPDLRTFIRLLHEHRVRYLLVGGEAVIYHGYPRLTGGVDFFFEQTVDNCERLYAALEEFWSGHVPAVRDAEELLDPDVVVQFGRPPNRIDLIGKISGVSFDAAWRGRVRDVMRIGRKKVPLPIIGLAQLIANTRRAGRAKDLDDLEHLEALRKRRRKR